MTTPMWVLVIYTILPSGDIANGHVWKHFEDRWACESKAHEMRVNKRNRDLYPACVLAKEVKL